MFAKPVFLALGLALLVANTGEGGHPWSYSGAEGPAHWDGTCASGKAQSPIDIRSASVKQARLDPLKFDYRPTALHVIDNGHSIQVDVDRGSTLEVGGARYTLVQFHFHRPGEEAVDGHHAAMVVHLVHRDARGHLAVVAVPLQRGSANPLVATLWHNLPHEMGHAVSLAKVAIDPSRLLPANHAYYTYAGSLTTPPCTEGVRWFVMKRPVTVSADEIATFARHYPDNARPVQGLHGRAVQAAG